MGGPYGNCIWIGEDWSWVQNGKYDGSSMPNYVLQGLDDYFIWMSQLFERYSNKDDKAIRSMTTLYEGWKASGAVLADARQKLLIIGFEDWHPLSTGRGDDVFDSIRSEYQVFHRHSNLKKEFLRIVAPLWPGWHIVFAETGSFGVLECLETDISKIKTINTGSETSIDASNEEITNNFRKIIQACFNYPAGKEVLDRLNI
ncbi:hypothetical protein Q0M94_03090 [Deinococcus radiomollis]|uniref:hypothetical protein n=1 Tax=Deinococcus radiomollis TaxID=468916 RepID=UPI003891F206